MMVSTDSQRCRLGRVVFAGWEHSRPSSSSQGGLGALCSHPEVILHCDSAILRPKSLQKQGPAHRGHRAGQDSVLVKFKCGAAPETTQFYLVLYRDTYKAQPVAVWHVYVHALRRVNLAGMVGQSSQTSVVVRGRPGAATRVACFSSHPDELQVRLCTLLRHVHVGLRTLSLSPRAAAAAA